MKTVIHVNQHVIRRNKKKGTSEPCLTTKTYKSNDYAHEVVIFDTEGNEAARVVYRPDKPLACGAHVWIETDPETLEGYWVFYNEGADYYWEASLLRGSLLD